MTQDRTVTVIVARRLDEAKSGNSVYLKAFLQLARDAGYKVRLIFAPSRSFGNKAWARIHSDFDPLLDVVQWPGTVRFGDLFVSTSPRVWLRLLGRIGYMIWHRLIGQADAKPKSLLGYELDPWEVQAVAKSAGDTEEALVVAEYSAIAPVLTHVKARSKAVLLHDLFSLRAASFKRAGQTPDHIDISIEDEAARSAAADTLFHASLSELAAMQKVMPDTRHIWMQPQVNVPTVFNPRPGNPRAVFFGVRHGGNVAALNLLIDEIWPKLRRKLPDAELWIAGTIGALVPEELQDRDNIKVLGIVEDLTEIGGTQSVGLAPTALESGVSIKVLEYMALQMPTLVLPGALNGYGDALDGLVERATDIDDYVDRLASLLGDAAKRERLALDASARLPDIVKNADLKEFLGSLK